MRRGAEDIRLFDDLFKIAGGAMKSFADVKPRLKAVIYTIIDELDLVPREDFERVEEIAEKALADNIKLEKRVRELEKTKTSSKNTSTKAKASKSKPGSRKSAPSKTTSKKTTAKNTKTAKTTDTKKAASKKSTKTAKKK